MSCMYHLNARRGRTYRWTSRINMKFQEKQRSRFKRLGVSYWAITVTSKGRNNHIRVFFLNIYFIYKYICVSVWVYGMCMCWCLQKPEENVRSFEAGVIGVYKTPHVGAGPWTPVLYKSSKHDWWLGHLSSPIQDVSSYCGLSTIS